jgi:hypothetical protein
VSESERSETNGAKGKGERLAIAKRLKRGTSVLTAKGSYAGLRPYAHRKREKNGAVLL